MCTLVFNEWKCSLFCPHHRDLHLDIILYGFKSIDKLFTCKRNSFSRFSRSCGSSYSVYITFKIFRNIVVYYKFKIINLQPSGCYICCYQKSQLTRFHTIDHLQSFALRKIPHKILCSIAIHIETLTYFDSLSLGIGEHQRIRSILSRHQP